MAQDRERPDDPAMDRPEQQRDVHPVPPQAQGKTFAQTLVPTVDTLRQLISDFGLRPYRVFLVHVKWTGERRGIGSPEEISRREILPTPKVADMSGTARSVMDVGTTELGGIRVSRISAKFTEDDLLGRSPDLRRSDLPRTGDKAVEFYWEVIQQRPGYTEQARRRRFVPDSAGDLKPGQFGWTVSLRRQQGDAARDGRLDRERF